MNATSIEYFTSGKFSDIEDYLNNLEYLRSDFIECEDVNVSLRKF